MKKIIILATVFSMSLLVAAPKAQVEAKKCSMDAEKACSMNCMVKAADEIVCPVCCAKAKADKAVKVKANKEECQVCSKACAKKCKKDMKKYKEICKKVDEANEEVVCPVKKEKIKKGEAFAVVEKNGETYYLCCEKCQKAFNKNSKKYTKKVKK